jgi:hypothetical protein
LLGETPASAGGFAVADGPFDVKLIRLAVGDVQSDAADTPLRSQAGASRPVRVQTDWR